MKKTTNRIQENYMKAKALVETIRFSMEELERQYIADNGIVNPDGSVPELIYCMDDEAAFDKANEEFSAVMVSAGFEAKSNAARDALRVAEDRLIEYGLSIAPAKIREVLQRGIKENACTRMKIIDITFKLDVSTAPKRA